MKLVFLALFLCVLVAVLGWVREEGFLDADCVSMNAVDNVRINPRADGARRPRPVKPKRTTASIPLRILPLVLS